MKNTVQPHYLHKPAKGIFSRTMFEVSIIHGKTGSNHRESSKNPLVRIQNALLSALRSKIEIPKMLIVILEDDIIRYLNYQGHGVTEMHGKLIDYLSKELRKLITKFKTDFLPTKSKKSYISANRVDHTYPKFGVQQQYAAEEVRGRDGGHPTVPSKHISFPS